MKRSIVAVLVAVLIAACANLAPAAQPSDAALADMGLAGMQVMSDTEALAVRGQGFSIKTTSHSKVIKFSHAYATPNGKVTAKGFAWAVAY